MESVTGPSDQRVSKLVVVWVLLIPLFYLASLGHLWFLSGGGNNPLFGAFGGIMAAPWSGPDHVANKVVRAMTLLIVCFRFRQVTRSCCKDGIFISMVVLAVASTVWSQAPEASLPGSMYLAIDTMFAFYLSLRFSPSQLLAVLRFLGWICLIFSFILAMFFPKYGIDSVQSINSWRGIYNTKNVCAEITTFLLSGALFEPAQSGISKVFRVLYICLSIFMVLMTRSLTGAVLLAFLLAFSIGIVFLNKFRKQDSVVVLLLGTTIISPLVAAGFAHSAEIFYFLGKDPSMTGRTAIWASVSGSIMKHPLLGYGYSAFWTGLRGESANVSLANHWIVPHAHNGVFELWLELGAVGVALVLFSVVRAFKNALPCLLAAKYYFNWYVCILFLMVIYAVDEPPLLAPNNLSWILFIVACVGLSQGARRIRLGQDHA